MVWLWIYLIVGFVYTCIIFIKAKDTNKYEEVKNMANTRNVPYLALITMAFIIEVLLFPYFLFDKVKGIFEKSGK